jgi:3',5'-cyclic-AMP phosphodiesterase
VAGVSIKLPEKSGLDRIDERGTLGFRRALRVPPVLSACVVAFAMALVWPGRSTKADASFHFELLGDRTGEAQPGVFEEALREAAATKPAFILTVGDSIQGGDDSTAEAEWRKFETLFAPYKKIPLFLTPGNHDVWSEVSASLYMRHAHHALRYSFDYGLAHFIILNNSRGNDGARAAFAPDELEFLEKDLAVNTRQPVKFVVSHRPTWLVPIMLGNRRSPFHQLMLKYGVKYVIAGHIHQMLHVEMDGVTYVDLASSGGHLRDTKTYERGWFFQHTAVTVNGTHATLVIHELLPPLGRGRATSPDDWSTAGLTQ